VWLTLPWTIKMVFGQLADSVPILGSQRRVYVVFGASLVASGLVLMAGAADGWIAFAGKNALYVAAQLLIVVGVGARAIALIDTTTELPFAELSMIPALAHVAINAPAGRRATWFALMASLMNVALVAAQLQTKYLNRWFEVGRDAYGDLAALTIVAAIIGFVVPVCRYRRFRQARHLTTPRYGAIQPKSEHSRLCHLTLRVATTYS
jgi:hypothetical protein